MKRGEWSKTEIGRKFASDKAKKQWVSGSLHGFSKNKDIREKISKAHLGKDYLSFEQRSAMTKKWLAIKGHPKGMLGKHHSEITKQKFSEMRKGGTFDLSLEETKRRSNNLQTITLKNKQNWGGYKWNNIRRGKREDLGGIFFRSSWEANYARYLKWLKERGEILNWEYEPRTFIFHEIELGVRSYTPDFRVIEKNGSQDNYHEVKGWMDAKSQTKLNRMAKYYPEIKITIIDGKSYKDIENKVYRLIPFWE